MTIQDIESSTIDHRQSRWGATRSCRTVPRRVHPVLRTIRTGWEMGAGTEGCIGGEPEFCRCLYCVLGVIPIKKKRNDVKSSRFQGGVNHQPAELCVDKLKSNGVKGNTLEFPMESLNVGKSTRIS